MALDISKLTPDFGDAAAEAQVCRSNCALFDFSFLESAHIEGRRATAIIEALSGRAVNSMRQGEIVYAVRVNDAGNACADLTVWKTDEHSFEIMSGRRQDIVDLLAFNGKGAQVTDLTATRAVFAAQGPGTHDALMRVGNFERVAELKHFNFTRVNVCGTPCIVGRLGYTGEAGFEIIVHRDRAGELWQGLSTHMRPAGFAAADMLRIEAGFVLFTNEFQFPVTPDEAGLGKFHRSAEPGHRTLRLVSFRADARGLSWPWRATSVPPRPETSGVIAVTSACDSIAAGGILGLGYVLDGTASDTSLRDSAAVFQNIRLAPLPFYDTAKRRPRMPWR